MLYATKQIQDYVMDTSLNTKFICENKHLKVH